MVSGLIINSVFQLGLISKSWAIACWIVLLTMTWGPPWVNLRNEVMEVVIDGKNLGTKILGHIDSASSAGSCSSVQVTFIRGTLESQVMIVYDLWYFEDGLIPDTIAQLLTIDQLLLLIVKHIYLSSIQNQQ